MTTQSACSQNGAGVARKKGWFLFLTALFIWTVLVGVMLWYFPWETHQAQVVELLSVPEGALQGGVYEEYVSRDVFLQLAKSEPSAMAVQEDVVIYEIVLNDVSFRHRQWIGPQAEYTVEDTYEVNNGVLTRSLRRNSGFVLRFYGFVLVVIVATGFLIFKFLRPETEEHTAKP